MIDTHCHLTFPDFAPPEFPGGVDAVLAEAARHGVTGCITISTTTRDCLEALAVAHPRPRVWCTAGVHPLYSDDAPHEWANLRVVAEHPKCVAWGELGLDNHYSDPPKALQHQVLEEQLAFIQRCHADWASRGLARTWLPIVLHCREAFADLIPILRRTSLDPERFVFHCFTGTRAEMTALLDFGACVSFTGVITYRNARELHEAVRLPPADRVMVETDAPFLSPDPHRGVKPCQPWMVSVTARRLAELRHEPFDTLHQHLNDNTARFFGITEPRP